MCQCACAVSECLCFALTSYPFSFLSFSNAPIPKQHVPILLLMWPLTTSLGPAHPLTSPFLCPRVFLASISQTPFLHMLRFWSHLFLDFTHQSPPPTHQGHSPLLWAFLLRFSSFASKNASLFLFNHFFCLYFNFTSLNTFLLLIK